MLAVVWNPGSGQGKLFWLPGTVPAMRGWSRVPTGAVAVEMTWMVGGWSVPPAANGPGMNSSMRVAEATGTTTLELLVALRVTPPGIGPPFHEPVPGTSDTDTGVAPGASWVRTRRFEMLLTPMPPAEVGTTVAPDWLSVV